MKIKAVCSVLAPVLAVGAPFMWPALSDMRHAMMKPSHPMGAMALLTLPSLKSPSSPDAKPLLNPDGTPAPSFTVPAPSGLAGAGPDGHGDLVELQTGAEMGIIKAEFIANGRDTVKARFFNGGQKSLTVQVDAGQMLDAGLNTVAISRGTALQMEPGQTCDLTLPTVPTRTGNKTTEQNYKLSHGRMPQLEKLFTYLTAHPEISNEAIQTAVLALTENLPLSAVCKFTPVAGELKSRFDTDAFRVETGEIISALGVLREVGIPDSSIALTVDPQLRIEAMIEPLCRAAAMKYYGIGASNEWAFWQDQLLHGDPRTRHYALYGIARFYPDVAMQMLPKWAREPKTSPVFRLAAVQALADTQRPEALPVLRRLADELGLETQLGRTAAESAQYLDDYLANVNTRQASVSFRSVARVTEL